jgi:HEAT repeat protein
MELGKAAWLFTCQAIWRVTGARAAGRFLVRSLGSDDENVRVIAGMFLVRAGKRAEPLLEEALRRRENLPMVLSILGDIGNEKFESNLRQFTSDRDPRVAQAAQNALRVLAAHH